MGQVVQWVLIINSFKHVRFSSDFLMNDFGALGKFMNVQKQNRKFKM